MSAHSSLLGGSIATRRKRCPASFQEGLKAPPSATSVYAEDGTACHDAMAYWLSHPDDDLLGLTFNDIVITQEHIDTLLTPAWDALVDLQEQYGGGFKVTHLEKQVLFPGIPGSFGTADVILESKTHFILADFKFGAGVQVIVHVKDLNDQLLFYLCGGRKLIKKRIAVIAIIQPTFEPHYTHAIVTSKQLDQFEKDMHKAVAQALSEDPPRARGDWCRFANCKMTCVLWTGPLLDLSAIGKPPVEFPPNEEWGIFLSRAKRLVDAALAYRKDIDAALMDHLRAGGKAPGFALKNEVKNRKWLDDTLRVAKVLKKLGLPDDKIWQHKLQTFAIVDAAAKKLGVVIPDDLRPRPISTELTLTYDGDPEAVDVGRQAVEFSAALKRLERKTG